MSQVSQINIDHQQLIDLYRKALLTEGSFEDLEGKVEQKLTRILVSDKVEREHDQVKSQNFIRSLPKSVRIGAVMLPLFLIIIGFFMLSSALMPIIASHFKNITQSKNQQLIAPIPEDQIIDVNPLIIADAPTEPVQLNPKKPDNSGRSEPVIVNTDLDYTNLSNWFEDPSKKDIQNISNLLNQEVTEYYLDIPKLDITNALVKIGSDDLDTSLIQYPGTALPGKPGTPVIFGHSLLRQFYNPKESNPRRYKSIFSYIMSLEKGDKIYLRYKDATYTYSVQSKTEVNPEDIYILSQDYTIRQLKLVTCVPEGTYMRRGVVVAQLVRG